MEQSQMITLLKHEVEQKLGRVIQTTGDFDFLSMDISDHLHERISPSTLKRMFGYLESQNSPSRGSLNIMSRYLGYADWDAFVEKNSKCETTASCSNLSIEQIHDESQSTNANESPLTDANVVQKLIAWRRNNKKLWLCIILAGIIVIFVLAYFAGKHQQEEDLKDIRTSQLARPKDMNDPHNVELFRRGDLLYRRWFKSKFAVTVECVNKNVTSVTIPDSVTYNDTTYHVGELSFDCFKDCKHLKTVYFKGGNRHLQNGVFKGCDSLKVISFFSNIPPGIGNGGWPASVPEIFDDHHFEDVTLYLTPYLYKHVDEFPAWGEFTHRELRNPEPPKKDKK